ncbi:TPA: LysM peptidoglycan-binding domain-containing protein [Streptococcus suis]
MKKSATIKGLVLAIGLATTVLSSQVASVQAQASTATYIVQAGDTLYSIAKKHQVTVTDLKNWNHLTTEVIQPGQAISLQATSMRLPQDASQAPAPATTSQTSQTPAVETTGQASETSENLQTNSGYRVKAGDTLYQIASANQVSLADLKAWNKLTSDRIQIGQELQIKGPSQPVPGPSQNPTSPAANIYKVQVGDSLYKIATAYGVKVTDIKAWNQLTSDLIFVGQSLKVQASPLKTDSQPATSTKPQATIHTVVTGDNLYRLAKVYQTSPAQIRAWNNLKDNTLYLGQKLIVAVPHLQNQSPGLTTGTVYTVLRGDSLSKIAAAYKVSVTDLKTWNNLPSDLIFVGQRLTIKPSIPAKVKTYKVQKGDSLWTIAQSHKVTVAQLKAWNGLKSDLIFVGKVLQVQAP